MGGGDGVTIGYVTDSLFDGGTSNPAKREEFHLLLLVFLQGNSDLVSLYYSFGISLKHLAAVCLKYLKN